MRCVPVRSGPAPSRRFAIPVQVLAAWTMSLAAAPETAFDPARPEQIAAALESALVRVEYHLQYDRGDAPQGGGWRERCPNCGRFHGHNLETVLREERPLETPGFLLSARQVMGPDIQVHPRFIRAIEVRRGAQVVPARIAAIALDQQAVLLEFEGVLPGTEPLAFEPRGEGPYLAATYTRLNGDWTLSVQPLSLMHNLPETGDAFAAAPPFSVITASNGTPVALAMRDSIDVNREWKGSPLAWDMMRTPDLEAALARLETRADAALVRVSLDFRSPRAEPAARGLRHRIRSGRDEEATRLNVLGVVLRPERVLVLAELDPRTTARLEQIQLHHPEKGPVSAGYRGALKDFGAFFAEPETPWPEGLVAATEPVLRTRNRMLLRADIEMQGEQRVSYFMHGRPASFKVGWRNRIFPEMAGSSSDLFLFETDGRLVAFPLIQRIPVSADSQRSYRHRRANLMAAAALAEVFQEPDAHLDPANVPLSEAEENRLAWLGVELQPLNQELARANQVSDQTRDGQTGALVAHVYAGSPAERVGIAPGMVLLRLRTPVRPNPIEVRLEEGSAFSFMELWERLDEIPEQYFDQLPAPWPNADNEFNRMLTDLGMGTAVTIELSLLGAAVEKELTVVPGPPHYQAAASYNAESLGLTVRDLTYEARHYLQRRPEDPGVVVARLEPGSRATVAGIKPFELITHVNNAPVSSVREFETAIGAGGMLTLTVQRMAVERLVKIAGAERPD